MITKIDKIRRFLKKNPTATLSEVAVATGGDTTKSAFRTQVWVARRDVGAKVVRESSKKDLVFPSFEDVQANLFKFLRAPHTATEIAALLNTTVKHAEKLLLKMSKKYELSQVASMGVMISRPSFGRISIPATKSDWLKVGLIGDTHLCCEEERLDALHAYYDTCAEEGVTSVFHAGNIVDGYIQKINGQSVKDATIDGQVQYVIDNYPVRKGITTYFVTGDDHEGWWMQTSGINFGKYLEMAARAQGRTDLVYMGHVEADVELKTAGGSAIMKVAHPGGGTSYARSYTSQKIVESFQGGEKPHILVLGHYHVFNYINERNVHVVQLPGFQDQTIFARKKRLRMEIGGVIAEIRQNKADGSILDFKVWPKMYFDRAYYRPFIRSDVKLVSGRYILEKDVVKFHPAP